MFKRSLFAFCLLLTPAVPVQSLAQSSDDLLKQAQDLRGACQTAGVTPLLEQAVTADPSNAAAWSALAQHVGRSDPARAFKAHRIASRLAPQNKSVLGNLAAWQLFWGQTQAADVTLAQLEAVCSGDCSELIRARAVRTNKDLAFASPRISPREMNKDGVKAIQAALNVKGFSAGVVDGIYGKGSQRALIRYLQQTEGTDFMTCESRDRLLAPVPEPDPAPASTQPAETDDAVVQPAADAPDASSEG